jgi:hypothetical protein
MYVCMYVSRNNNNEKRKKRLRDPRACWAKTFVALLVAVHDQSGTIRIFLSKKPSAGSGPFGPLKIYKT